MRTFKNGHPSALPPRSALRTPLPHTKPNRPEQLESHPARPPAHRPPPSPTVSPSHRLILSPPSYNLLPQEPPTMAHDPLDTVIGIKDSQQRDPKAAAKHAAAAKAADERA